MVTSSPLAISSNILVMDRGGVYRPPDSKFWMMRFRYKGRLVRQSCGTTSKRQAIAALKRRMAEFGVGRDGMTLDVPTLREAADALLAHILATKKSGHAQVRSHLRNLLRHLGPGTRVSEIQPGDMESFMTLRRAAGLKDASVYNEMSTLRRCLRLLWKRGRILALPEFPMPTKGKARQGFFTWEEVSRLCEALPPHAANAVRFAWETGWRRGEIFDLRWENVDMRAGIIQLMHSKNGDSRQLPFGESEVLSRIIREQRASAAAFELRHGRAVGYVFHYAGRRLPEGLRRSWRTACRKAGIESRLFHDLRRSFIQRCEDVGVPRSSAMKITGHRTEAIYARYAVAPRASVAVALQQLENGEQNVHRPMGQRVKPRTHLGDKVSTG